MNGPLDIVDLDVPGALDAGWGDEETRT